MSPIGDIITLELLEHYSTTAPPTVTLIGSLVAIRLNLMFYSSPAFTEMLNNRHVGMPGWRKM